jgi:hypothetical protein
LLEGEERYGVPLPNPIIAQEARHALGAAGAEIGNDESDAHAGSRAI